MKALLVVLVLGVGGLAIAAELAAPRLVEARVEERARAQVAGAAGVDADAGRFPFVPRLLLDTEVARLAVTLEEVTGQQLTFSEVTLEMRGIHLDRDALFAGEVEVTAIDSGVATVAIHDDALGAVLGGMPTQVEVHDRSLSLGGADLAGAQVPIPHQLLPCDPVAETTGQGVEVTCEFHEVPDLLLRAAG